MVILTFLVCSCEREHSITVDYSVDQPYVLAASALVRHFNLSDTSDPFVVKQIDGSYLLSDSLSAWTINRGGTANVAGAWFRLYVPNSGVPVIVRSLGRPQSVAGAGNIDTLRYGTRFTFSTDTLNIGTYRLEVFLQNSSGYFSNSLLIPLVVTVNNRPPHLDLPQVRYVVPPGSDSALFTLAIPATDPDGIEDIASVQVQPKFASDTSARAMFDDGMQIHADRIAGDGVFSVVFRVDTASLHSIGLEFTATDRSGAPSNTIFKTLLNHPPEIISLDVPDSLQRPASGTQLIGFYMTVADSDGLSDIDSAYFRNFTSTSPTNFLMYDDGDSLHGDVTANDGIYSRVVSIDPSTSLGVKEFHFYVVDKAGYRDERIKYIKIYP